MKTTNNTVLITGGSAGIGLEIARLFSQKNNHVIILGRNKERLGIAAAQLKNVTAIQADVSNEDEVDGLVKKLNDEFPDLNVVINNAGRAILYDLNGSENAFDKAADEILTNYLSIIRLNEKLLPQLKKQKEAAIVNVSSIVAFVPGVIPTYSASKAALHSYTQSLRISLEETSVKVFELMPPLVDTEFSKEIGGSHGVQPLVVAEDLLKAFVNDEYEIRVGNTENIYKLFLSSPAEALKTMNASRKQILSAIK
jgi:uncharacterized oxidoreductase